VRYYYYINNANGADKMKIETAAKRLGLEVEVQEHHQAAGVTWNQVWVFDSEDDSEPLGYFLTNGSAWQWRKVWAGETGVAFASEKAANAYLKTMMPTVKANR
jgi:hypothetical protein